MIWKSQYFSTSSGRPSDAADFSQNSWNVGSWSRFGMMGSCGLRSMNVESMGLIQLSSSLRCSAQRDRIPFWSGWHRRAACSIHLWFLLRLLSNPVLLCLLSGRVTLTIHVYSSSTVFEIASLPPDLTAVFQHHAWSDGRIAHVTLHFYSLALWLASSQRCYNIDCVSLRLCFSNPSVFFEFFAFNIIS